MRPRQPDRPGERKLNHEVSWKKEFEARYNQAIQEAIANYEIRLKAANPQADAMTQDEWEDKMREVIAALSSDESREQLYQNALAQAIANAPGFPAMEKIINGIQENATYANPKDAHWAKRLGIYLEHWKKRQLGRAQIGLVAVGTVFSLGFFNGIGNLRTQQELMRRRTYAAELAKLQGEPLSDAERDARAVEAARRAVRTRAFGKNAVKVTVDDGMHPAANIDLPPDFSLAA